VGGFLLIILGVPVAARSDAPLLVFAETILFALVMAVSASPSRLRPSTVVEPACLR
jgi:hypothetical protein